MKSTSIIIPPHSVNPNRPFLFVYDFANEQYVSFTVEPNQQETEYHYVHKDQGLQLCTTRAVETYQVRMFESTDTNGEYDVVLEDMEMPNKRRRCDAGINEENLFLFPPFEDCTDSFENTFMTALSHEQQENEVKSLKKENKWLTCMVQALQAEMREKNEIQQNILKTCVQLAKDMEEMKKQCFQKKND